jgi:hypothetical protein
MGLDRGLELKKDGTFVLRFGTSCDDGDGKSGQVDSIWYVIADTFCYIYHLLLDEQIKSYNPPFVNIHSNKDNVRTRREETLSLSIQK